MRTLVHSSTPKSFRYRSQNVSSLPSIAKCEDSPPAEAWAEPDTATFGLGGAGVSVSADGDATETTCCCVTSELAAVRPAAAMGA